MQETNCHLPVRLLMEAENSVSYIPARFKNDEAFRVMYTMHTSAAGCRKVGGMDAGGIAERAAGRLRHNGS